MRTKHEVDVERETRATGEGAEEKFSAPYNPPPRPTPPHPIVRVWSSLLAKKKTAGKNIGGEKKEKEN